MPLKFYTTLILLLICRLLTAQTLPILDQNPAGLHWYQINTPYFRIIYPEGFDQEAMRTANVLERVYEPVSRTLQRQPRPIDIILQNQTAVSNGFVTITPRRSEFFTNPPQEVSLLGNNNWIDLLAIHEFRHVVQYEKALTGVSKAVYYAFGGNGLSLLSFMAVPVWFWEGDAVATETALTRGGRGRIPRFDLALRTQLLTRGPYSYQKAYMRSYKDYVPNHYVLGYFITSHMRREYGANSWSRVLNRTYKFPFIPFAFSRAIKKETGLRVEGLYKQAMHEVDSLWTAQVEGLKETDTTMLRTERNRVFTDYEYPQYLQDGRILAQKSGMADVEQFVILDEEQKEETAFVPGYLNRSGMLSVSNDVVIWSEQGFDPRWRMRTYTVLKLYDLKTKQLRQLTHKTRMSSPALSPDNSKVVAVSVSQAGDVRLVILDSQTGAELQTLPNPNNDFYLMPRFSPDGSKVVAVKLNYSKGKTIELFDLNSNTSEELMPYANYNLAHAVMHGDFVFYNSPYNGIDNIYALHLPSRRHYQVVSRKYGAFNPAISPDGKELAYNDFTPKGFRIVTMPLDTTLWTPLEQVKDRTVAYYAPLVEQEGGNVLTEVPEKTYPVKDFNRVKSLINPYTWSPFISSDGRQLTASITSQDLLSTLLIDAGYGYNANERSSSFFGRVSYQGFYPVLDLSVETRQRNATRAFPSNGRAEQTLITDQWRETNLSVGFRLPFNLTHSRYSESLHVSAHSNYTRVSDFGFPFRSFFEISNGSVQSMQYRLSYRRLHKTSLRDVAPRWGQTFFSQYKHTPFGGTFKGAQLAIEGNLFVPGLMKHHSLRLRGGFQQESATNYRFVTPLFFPRGHLYRPFDRFYNGALEYRLPIINPDLAIGRWLYFQRVKGTAFYDYGKGFTANGTREYQALGLDLTTEFNVVRLLPILEVGVRTIYFPQSQNFSFQFLVVDVGF